MPALDEFNSTFRPCSQNFSLILDNQGCWVLHIRNCSYFAVFIIVLSVVIFSGDHHDTLTPAHWQEWQANDCLEAAEGTEE